MKILDIPVISIVDLANELNVSVEKIKIAIARDEEEAKQDYITYNAKERCCFTNSLEVKIKECIKKFFSDNTILIKNCNGYKVTFIKKEIIYVEATTADEAIEKGYDIIDKNPNAYFAEIQPVDEVECEVIGS